MFLSQSAITQATSNLEATLGYVLFKRTSRGVHTTDAGNIFLQRIERAIHWLSYIEPLFPSKSKSRRRLSHNLTAKQLRALVAVVEHGSYSLAANHLGLTQPSVHRAVKEIESLCETSFFQRSPSGVEPTWQTRQTARYASLYFSELEQGIDELHEYEGEIKGSLKIGSLPLARTRIVPSAVTQLLNELPSAQVSIIDGAYEEQLHALRHGQLDLIVGALRNQLPSQDIEQHQLFRDALYIVFRPNHPLASRQAISVLELQEMSWVAPSERTPARAAFTKFFNDRGLRPPEHVIECSSLISTRAFLLESDRAALLSKRQVETDVDKGILAVSPSALAGTDRNIGYTVRKDWKPTLLQTRFIELLRKIIE